MHLAIQMLHLAILPLAIQMLYLAILPLGSPKIVGPVGEQAKMRKGKRKKSTLPGVAAALFVAAVVVADGSVPGAVVVGTVLVAAGSVLGGSGAAVVVAVAP